MQPICYLRELKNGQSQERRGEVNGFFCDAVALSPVRLTSPDAYFIAPPEIKSGFQGQDAGILLGSRDLLTVQEGPCWKFPNILSRIKERG